MAYYNLRNKTKRNETKRNENLYFAKKKKTILSHKKIKGTWVSFIFLANVIFYLETYSDTFHVHFPFYFLESQNNFFRKLEIFIIHRQRTLITPYRRYRYL